LVARAVSVSGCRSWEPRTSRRVRHPIPLSSLIRLTGEQQPLVGRAIGRVLAHEIGHWLRGRGHTTTGLMKAVLRGHELVDPLAPPLPREWTSAGPAPLLAGASRCKPPRTPLSAKPTV
jgi:hypothetical protein